MNQINMCFQVGRALSELHHVNIVPIESESLITLIETLNQRKRWYGDGDGCKQKC